MSSRARSAGGLCAACRPRVGPPGEQEGKPASPRHRNRLGGQLSAQGLKLPRSEPVQSAPVPLPRCLAEFAPAGANKLNHFSRKSHFREKFFSRRECASASECANAAQPPVQKPSEAGSERSGAPPRLAEFAPAGANKLNHFSRKSHFREKFLSRRECASEASARTQRNPPPFRSPAKRVLNGAKRSAAPRSEAQRSGF